MRYASAIFDKYGDTLSEIDDYAKLEAFFDRIDLPSDFRGYAARTDGITATQKEWAETEKYLLPQIRGLIGRYSKLGENAYYKMYLSVDTTLRKAIGLD